MHSSEFQYEIPKLGDRPSAVSLWKNSQVEAPRTPKGYAQSIERMQSGREKRTKTLASRRARCKAARTSFSFGDGVKTNQTRKQPMATLQVNMRKKMRCSSGKIEISIFEETNIAEITKFYQQCFGLPGGVAAEIFHHLHTLIKEALATPRASKAQEEALGGTGRKRSHSYPDIGEACAVAQARHSFSVASDENFPLGGPGTFPLREQPIAVKRSIAEGHREKHVSEARNPLLGPPPQVSPSEEFPNPPTPGATAHRQVPSAMLLGATAHREVPTHAPLCQQQPTASARSTDVTTPTRRYGRGALEWRQTPETAAPHLSATSTTPLPLWDRRQSDPDAHIWSPRARRAREFLRQTSAPPGILEFKISAPTQPPTSRHERTDNPWMPPLDIPNPLIPLQIDQYNGRGTSESGDSSGSTSTESFASFCPTEILRAYLGTRPSETPHDVCGSSEGDRKFSRTKFSRWISSQNQTEFLGALYAKWVPIWSREYRERNNRKPSIEKARFGFLSFLPFRRTYDDEKSRAKRHLNDCSLLLLDFMHKGFTQPLLLMELESDQISRVIEAMIDALVQDEMYAVLRPLSLVESDAEAKDCLLRLIWMCLMLSTEKQRSITAKARVWSRQLFCSAGVKECNVSKELMKQLFLEISKKAV